MSKEASFKEKTVNVSVFFNWRREVCDNVLCIYNTFSFK